MPVLNFLLLSPYSIKSGSLLKSIWLLYLPSYSPFFVCCIWKMNSFFFQMAKNHWITKPSMVLYMLLRLHLVVRAAGLL